MQDGFEHVCVPDLGTNQPIRFVGWLVNNKARVIPGERIAEIMCDGCVIHIEATQAGEIRLEQTQFGPTIQVGEILARIELDN